MHVVLASDQIHLQFSFMECVDRGIPGMEIRHAIDF